MYYGHVHSQVLFQAQHIKDGGKSTKSKLHLRLVRKILAQHYAWHPSSHIQEVLSLEAQYLQYLIPAAPEQ